MHEIYLSHQKVLNLKDDTLDREARKTKLHRSLMNLVWRLIETI